MTVEELRQLKKEALDYWKKTGDIQVRTCMRKIDKMIVKELKKDNGK